MVEKANRITATARHKGNSLEKPGRKGRPDVQLHAAWTVNGLDAVPASVRMKRPVFGVHTKTTPEMVITKAVIVQNHNGTMKRSKQRKTTPSVTALWCANGRVCDSQPIPRPLSLENAPV